MSVADGRSTTTITAEVRDSRGNLVADGTKVSFESTLGLFREALVSTTGGFARAVLQAGGVPRIATITVKTVDTLSQPSTIEFEFVGDRSDLSSATEYIELVSPGYMEFVPDSRIMAASAPNKAVSIRYRNVVIEADDIQINISRYEVRARNARLKVGKLNREFDELYFKLKDRTGIGTGTFKAILPSPFKMEGFVPRPQTGEPGRYANVGKEVERYGDNYALYLRVRPGITGLWQVSGRNDLTYAERVRLDVYYVRNWSVWLDLYLLSRTTMPVIYGNGAY